MRACVHCFAAPLFDTCLPLPLHYFNLPPPHPHHYRPAPKHQAPNTRKTPQHPPAPSSLRQRPSWEAQAIIAALDLSSTLPSHTKSNNNSSRTATQRPTRPREIPCRLKERTKQPHLLSAYIIDCQHNQKRDVLFGRKERKNSVRCLEQQFHALALLGFLVQLQENILSHPPPSTTTSETDALAIFDQTQRPDTSIASPSIGPIVIF
jgi:hypothetical protein